MIRDRAGLCGVQPHEVAREQALDRIEAAAMTSPTFNGGNPRYFAEMFAATLACNPRSEAIALRCIEGAITRCVEEQVAARARGEW